MERGQWHQSINTRLGFPQRPSPVASRAEFFRYVRSLQLRLAIWWIPLAVVAFTVGSWLVYVVAACALFFILELANLTIKIRRAEQNATKPHG